MPWGPPRTPPPAAAASTSARGAHRPAPQPALCTPVFWTAVAGGCWHRNPHPQLPHPGKASSGACRMPRGTQPTPPLAAAASTSARGAHRPAPQPALCTPVSWTAVAGSPSPVMSHSICAAHLKCGVMHVGHRGGAPLAAGDRRQRTAQTTHLPPKLSTPLRSAPST